MLSIAPYGTGNHGPQLDVVVFLQELVQLTNNGPLRKCWNALGMGSVEVQFEVFLLSFDLSSYSLIHYFLFLYISFFWFNGDSINSFKKKLQIGFKYKILLSCYQVASAYERPCHFTKYSGTTSEPDFPILSANILSTWCWNNMCKKIH